MARSDDEGRRKVPSGVRFRPTRPVPSSVVENPCPPFDPRCHAIWVEVMRASDRRRRRPAGFFDRGTHYAPNGELWDAFWPEN